MPRLLFRTCIVVVLFFASAARADEALWRMLADRVFHPVARDLDLPNVLIPEAMAQDAQGYLWIGEETGLLRWDGYRFRSYAYDRRQPDGLQDDFIQSLYRDVHGTLWIGTVSGGLARYDAATDRVVAVPLDTPKGTSLRVFAMADDGAGGLWVATGSGLVHLGPGGGVKAHLRRQDRAPGGLPDDVVSAMLRDRRGTLWIATGSGLARGMDNNTHFAAVDLPAGGNAGKVQHLLEDSGGRIWVATRHDGAFVVDPVTGVAQQIAATGQLASEIATPEVTSIVEIMPGRIWLGTYGRGIVEVDADTLRSHRIRHDPLVPSSLDSDTIRSLFRDRSGLVWIGTNQGLSQHMPGNGGILTVFGAAGRTAGLTDGDVAAILARRDGSLWVGTQGGGLDIFDVSGHRIAVLPAGRVFCLADAPAGGVLVGTHDGFFLADDKGQRLTRLTIPERGAAIGVFALRVIGGAVWLGGLDDGVWQLHVDAAGQVKVLQHVMAGGLATADVRAIEAVPDGRIAIGTDDGFDLLDRTTGQVEHISPNPEAPDGLGAHHVMSFVTDRYGRLWVGTDSAGISVMQSRDPAGHWKFRRLTRADGLPNEDIDRMLLDRQGRIWASTDSGFAVIDPDSFAVHALRRPDGVAVTAYWNGSGTASPDGDLLFGGLGGMTVVRPDRIRLWDYQPEVVVTGLRVGGRDVPADPALTGGDAERWLQITPEANSVAVEFSALDFSAPSLNRYSYKLEGFDRGWIETDAAHRSADYTNLPPGDYTLWLRGSNRAGTWSKQVLALHIRVLAAWFQTLWFRLAALAVAAVAVLGVVQGRTLLLRRRQHELERQVADRTAELIASQERLHHFAFCDVLTALPNRRAFNDRLRALIDAWSQHGAPFALLLIDLDGFKQVNDSFGHDAGDELLMLSAGRMHACVGEGGFAARLGGDEFAILLPDATDETVVAGVCDRLVARLAEPAALRAGTVSAGASLGAAMFPAHGQDAEALLRHVDLALYEAKRAGRSTWRWYRHGHQPAFQFREVANPLMPRRVTGSR